MTALAQHDVEVELNRHLLIQLQTFIVKAHPGRREIVTADDGGVTAASPRPNIMLLHHSHIGDPILLRQIVGAGQPMPAAADDDDIVALF